MLLTANTFCSLSSFLLARRESRATNKLMETNKCVNSCEGGVLFTEMGENEFCSCEKGKKAEFFAWFAEEKMKLVKKMTYA